MTGRPLDSTLRKRPNTLGRAALVLAASGGVVAYETIKSYDGSRASPHRSRAARLPGRRPRGFDIAHTFFGYADSPTALQLIVYVAYVAPPWCCSSGCRAGCARQQLASGRPPR